MKQRWVLRGLKFAAIGIAAIGVFGFIVMSLWNWLAPPILGARPVDFWQALGILVLSKILFGGFRGGRGHGGHWRDRMKARWERMTPEEREKFRHGMAGCCVPAGAPAEGSADPGRA
jgi:hypothetical protein